jgi:hypothetical protein
MSLHDFRPHFGLGKATAASLSIRWLDGKIESFSKVAMGQIVIIQESKGIVRKQPYSIRKPEVSNFELGIGR